MTSMRFRRSATSLLLALSMMPGALAWAQQNGLTPVVKVRARVAAKPADAKTTSAPSPFHITGRVINSVSKSPVGRAEISVSPMGVRRANARFAGRGAGQTVATTTGVDGQFSVEVPTAGGWTVSVSAHGYHTQSFEEHDAYSTAIVLTEANPVFDLTFPLAPAGAIEGYVVDEAGEAVRNAQLTVSIVAPATPEEQHPRPQARGNQRTDDRGYFKFSGLLAGNYDLRLQAQPWYATNAGRGGQMFFNDSGGVIGSGASGGSNTGSAPDPLDVVYPVVWYPGGADYAAATPITLRRGETREADFHLSPIPGFHLRVASQPTQVESDDGRPIPGLFRSGYLSQVFPDGSEGPMTGLTHTDASGNTEFSGLAPGTYTIHRNGDPRGGGESGLIVQISANSARTIDASQLEPGIMATINVDEAADTNGLQIRFRDLDTGRAAVVERPRGPGSEATGAARKVNLQPGRYEVSLSGIGDFHLAGIEAKGATATGRIVTIAGGAPVLTLHVASGRSNVTGFVQSQGKPLHGALVLLVPATLGDSSGLELMRRDQSNTDGSFDMNNVLPGQYILVAIDHGWEINWSDPATLRGYLLHGLPLDLTTSGDKKETIQAQEP